MKDSEDEVSLEVEFCAAMLGYSMEELKEIMSKVTYDPKMLKVWKQQNDDVT